MTRFSRLQVATKILQTGLVPLFYHGDVEVVRGVIAACYSGGCRLVEFTHRSDFAHEVFASASKWSKQQFPDLMLGVGSVVDGPTASEYLRLGASFVVSPVLREDIATTCNRRKALWIAGCMTPKEIADCEELGAEIVKLFPCEALNPLFVRSIKAPSPWSSVMVTGGLSPNKESLLPWFGAGADCVALGSKLITPSHLAQRNFDDLEGTIRGLLATIGSLLQPKT